MEHQKIIIDPNMENQDVWNHYISQKTLRRKYLDINGIKTPIELSENTLNLIQQKKKQIMKKCFDKYHESHREKYNEFYRNRYHEKKKDNNKNIKDIKTKNYAQEYREKNKEKIQKYQAEYRQRKRESQKKEI